MTKSKSFILAIGLIIFGALTRLVDHLPNFSALESLALFSSAYISAKYLSFLVPILSMYISDLILNNSLARPFFENHEGFVLFDNYMIFNVLAMITIVFMGKYLLKKVTPVNIIGTSLIASTIFFIITNIGSWITLPIYSKDITGLITSFVNALPFFQTSILSTFCFSTILFGSYYFINTYIIRPTEKSTATFD